MAERNEEVFESVRQELVKRPNLSTGVLYEMARRIDPRIGEQSPQHFHVRYVVPVKHEQASAQRRDKRGARETRKPRTAAPQRRRAAAEAAPQPTPSVPPLPEAQPQLPQPQPSAPAPERRRSPRAPRAAPQPAGAARLWPHQNGAGERRRVRAVFLEFAREVAAAESRGEMVEVLRRLDHYVDRLMARRS